MRSRSFRFLCAGIAVVLLIEEDFAFLEGWNLPDLSRYEVIPRLIASPVA